MKEDLEYQAKMAAPFGMLGIRTEQGELAEIVFLPRTHREQPPRDPIADRVCGQIGRYLEDPLFRFDVSTRPRGTPFQRRVWALIEAIPSGRTETYADVAARLNSAARAVGQACGANPFPLLVPCHRVVARDGIGGFAHRGGGYLLEIKRWLLAHERGITA